MSVPVLTLSLCILMADATTKTSSDAVEQIEVRGDALRELETPEAASKVLFDRFELEAADLGEILARQEGIVVQRTGGLGSDTRLSLNGLSGEQVRYFIDGIPLDVGGLPVGIANVPLGIVDEVVVYRGVVPTRLGADALGGAIELRTRTEVFGTEIQASYLTGSFGTHRASVVAAHAFNDDGLFVRAYGFGDLAENDYDVDAPIIDDSGQDRIESVERFNDAFRSFGASAEMGWAENADFGTLTLRAYFSSSRKELPTNPRGSIAFGEVERSIDVMGSVLRFDVPLGDDIQLAGNLGVARAFRSFSDESACVFNFLGECAQQRATPGELQEFASDLTQTNTSSFLRTTLEWRAAEHHTLRISVAPTLTFSDGEQRRERTGGIIDPAEADRRLISIVGGAEYELRAFSERLTTLAFIKGYGQDGQTEVIDGTEISGTDTFSSVNAGGGLLVRWGIAGPLAVEASYEFATRLPNESELFGTPGLVLANTDLLPERSHNINVGLKLEPWRGRLGQLRGTLNGFLRNTENWIRLVGNSLFFVYANVLETRSIGAESLLSWTSKGRYVSLDASATYMDFRNTSTTGPNAARNGDRIPNLPYFFGALTARLRFSKLLQNEDVIELAWTTRYVNEFFVTWESIGDPQFKPTVDSQFPSSANIGYRFDVFDQEVAMSFDIQNVTNEKLFDFFGVQRPGRAFYVRIGTTISP